MQNFTYKIDNNILTYEEIKLALDTLHDDLKDLSINDKILIIFKVHNTHDMWRSVSVNQCISMSEFDQLYAIFNIYWDVTHNDYHNWIIDKIGFRYMVINPLNAPPRSYTTFPVELRENKSYPPIGRRNLPNNTDFHKWGGIVYFHEDNKKWVVALENYEFYIEKQGNINKVEVIFKNKVMLSFTDECTNDPYIFVRNVCNDIIHYVHGLGILVKHKT